MQLSGKRKYSNPLLLSLSRDTIQIMKHPLTAEGQRLNLLNDLSYVIRSRSSRTRSRQERQRQDYSPFGGDPVVLGSLRRNLNTMARHVDHEAGALRGRMLTSGNSSQEFDARTIKPKGARRSGSERRKRQKLRLQ